MNLEKALSILGLNINYTDEDLKKTYRKLAKTHHPDLSTGSQTKFEQIKEAYEYLKLNKGRHFSVHNREKPKFVYHGKSIFDYVVK